MNVSAIAAAQSDTGVVTIGAEAFHFRGFRLLPASRILLHHGEPVDIGSRAFDLFHVLLRSRGHIVDREEIFRHVWPTTTVEESNLRAQVASLRKVLGEDRELLKTVPGRGYVLAADIAPVAPRLVTVPAMVAPAGRDPSTEAEVLRRLLRSVLDELWEITRENPRVAARLAAN